MASKIIAGAVAAVVTTVSAIAVAVASSGGQQQQASQQQTNVQTTTNKFTLAIAQKSGGGIAITGTGMLPNTTYTIYLQDASNPLLNDMLLTQTKAAVLSDENGNFSSALPNNTLAAQGDSVYAQANIGGPNTGGNAIATSNTIAFYTATTGTTPTVNPFVNPQTIPALTYNPQMSINGSSDSNGNPIINVTGSGFYPNTLETLWLIMQWGNGQQPIQESPSVVTDAMGNFSYTFSNGGGGQISASPAYVYYVNATDAAGNQVSSNVQTSPGGTFRY